MKSLKALLSTSAALALLCGSASLAQSRPASPTKEERVAELIRRELLLEQSHLWKSAIDTNLEILKLEPKNTAA